MNSDEIIIKVFNDRIYFNPKLSILIQHTNILTSHMSFKTHYDIFWKVEMVKYNSEDRSLKVKVKDYNANDISKFDIQTPKKQIDKLLFEKFDWQKLEPHLYSYRKNSLQEIIFNTDKTPSSSSNADMTKLEKLKLLITSSFTQVEKKVEYKPFVTNFQEDFWIYFSDAHFMLGYVTFKKYIKKRECEIDFKIKNEHILAEFDNVKFWFAKKLKTRKFKVSATITLTDDVVTETTASSIQIDQITPELIDSIKYQRTFALTKEPKFTTIDKALFTADEIFNQFDSDDIEGNVFNQSEEDILNFLLEKNKIRNKRQLEYLSGKKQSENHKLRYTLNPNFGFLFLVIGETNNHFVWELLNSHATYIWSIDKLEMEIELQFKRIESIVNTIRTMGRENYKRAYKNNHQDNDLVFRPISHKDIGSNLVDNFPKWKSQLNEQLT